MGKLFIVIVLGGFTYLAGVYRSETLMMFVLLMLFLAAVMFVLSLYQPRRIKVKAEVKRAAVVKGSSLPVCLTVMNTSWLPVMRLEVFLKEKKKKISCYVPGKGSAKAQTEVRCDYCGLLEVQVSHIKTYDFLLLFGRKKKISASCETAVLPVGRPMQITAGHMPSGMEEEEGGVSLPGGQPPEIYQIQKYQPGDGMRDIHWKLSARSGELLSKEYSMESRMPIFVFWNTRMAKKLEAEERDAFWELCFSLCSGLLEAGLKHQAGCWDAVRRQVRVYPITTLEDIGEFMIQLWRNAEVFREDYPEEVCLYEMYRHEEMGELFLSLNTNLELFLYDKLMMQFYKEDYEEKISECRFNLW